MARYYWDKRDNVDDYKQFPISFLVKHRYLKTDILSRSGIISWSRNGNPTGSISFTVSKDDDRRVGNVRVQFTQTNNETGLRKDFDYEIGIIATPCNYGGLRWYFLDPCDPTHRRCSILYLQGNGWFAGRKTLNLAYDSQNESKNPFWKAEFASIRGMVLYEKIKYRYRNGRPTRKMRRAIKYLSNGLSAKGYGVEDIVSSRIRL